LVEDFPSKGFFQDGKAVAIEVKFIRDANPKKVCNDAQFDYVKIIKNLKVANEFLIENGRYKNVAVSDFSYIILIVCKTKGIYDIACEKLRCAIVKNACPKNVFPIVFGHDQLTELNLSLS
jgi:hypothetical protein